jgi:hypothetical protein
MLGWFLCPMGDHLWTDPADLFHKSSTEDVGRIDFLYLGKL